MSEGTTELNARQTTAIVIAAVGLAAVLRLINANADFWFDEIIAVVYCFTPPLRSVISTYGLAGNHVLYSVLAHVAASLFGPAPWAVRLPAILFGIADVWAFWFVASEIWRRVPALLGTLLLAVSYHHIYYSQDARGYTALIFFALLATGLLLRMLCRQGQERSRLKLLGYSTAIALGLYSLLLMLFVVAGHAAVLVARRRWRPLASLAAGVCLAALLYAPMAPSLVQFYRANPSATGYPLLSLAFARSLAPLAFVLLAGGAVALPVMLRFTRRQPVVAALLLLPLVFNVLVPLASGQGVYPRAFMYGLVVAYLLLVEAIDWALLERPFVAWLMAGVVAVASIVQLVPYYRLPKQGFRQAVSYIDEHRAPTDDRIGLTLGGKAARFYDPSIVLIENAGQLREWTSRRRPAWIISTFPAEMRSSAPELYEWLQAQASHRRAFPGVIGDGTVHVHYWNPDEGRRP